MLLSNEMMSAIIVLDQHMELDFYTGLWYMVYGVV